MSHGSEETKKERESGQIRGKNKKGKDDKILLHVNVQLFLRDHRLVQLTRE